MEKNETKKFTIFSMNMFDYNLQINNQQKQQDVYGL